MLIFIIKTLKIICLCVASWISRTQSNFPIVGFYKSLMEKGTRLRELHTGSFRNFISLKATSAVPLMETGKAGLAGNYFLT